jgi:hypothetical protein
MSACVRSVQLEVRAPYVTSSSWALCWPYSPRCQDALPSAGAFPSPGAHQVSHICAHAIPLSLPLQPPPLFIARKFAYRTYCYLMVSAP